MPKSRKTSRSHCSFCGGERNTVPMLITSQLEDAAICNTCAMTVVQQMFFHFAEVEMRVRQMSTAPPRVILPDSHTVEQAIKKVNGDATG